MSQINDSQPLFLQSFDFVTHQTSPLLPAEQSEQRVETPHTPATAAASTQVPELQSYASAQRQQLHRQADEQESSNDGALIGGTAGSTAAQFARHESQIRGSGRISVTNTLMDYGYDNTYVREENLNTDDFVAKLRDDLNKLAPGTTVSVRPSDAEGRQIWDSFHNNPPVNVTVIKAPPPWEREVAIVVPAPLHKRDKNHKAGYRLIDQLYNNPHPVAIHKFRAEESAVTVPRDTNASFGSVAKPGKGSAVEIAYNPDAPHLRVVGMTDDYKYVYASTETATVFGHEGIHGSHQQRGTRPGTMGDHGKPNIFKVDGKHFRERNDTSLRLKEEHRTRGMDEHSYGAEPTERLLRAEIGNLEGMSPTYQTLNSDQPISRFEAFAARASNHLQNLGDVAIDTARGSGNSASLGAVFGAVSAVSRGENVAGVAADAALGAAVGVTQEFVERAVNGPRAATSGMTASSLRAAASQVRGAAVAGAAISFAFAVDDQWKNLQTDATRSQAIGALAGEAMVGAAAGATGAYGGALAGAALGSVVPVAGTVVGAVVGFAVGAAAGYAADQGLRAARVHQAAAAVVTTGYEAVSQVGSAAIAGVRSASRGAEQLIEAAGSGVARGVESTLLGATRRLASIFG